MCMYQAPIKLPVTLWILLYGAGEATLADSAANSPVDSNEMGTSVNVARLATTT